MTSRGCEHEGAVLAQMMDAPWSDAPRELQAHVARCDTCRDLLDVASALREDHAQALLQVHVPSAGQVWWRAELRARQDAAARAARPITLAAGVAAACFVGVLASVGGALSWWVLGWARQQELIAVLLASVETVGDIVPGAGAWLALLLVLGLGLLAAPLAVYFAVHDE